MIKTNKEFMTGKERKCSYFQGEGAHMLNREIKTSIKQWYVFYGVITAVKIPSL